MALLSLGERVCDLNLVNFTKCSPSAGIGRPIHTVAAEEFVSPAGWAAVVPTALMSQERCICHGHFGFNEEDQVNCSK